MDDTIIGATGPTGGTGPVEDPEDTGPVEEPESPTFSLTVTLPAVLAARIANAYCRTYGYAAFGTDDAVQFIQNRILDDLRRLTLEFEAQEAARIAREAVFSNQEDPLVNPSIQE